MNSATPGATTSIEPASVRIDHLEQGTSLWKDAWYRLKKNRVALFGLCAFCSVAILCLIGPYFTGRTYEQTEIGLKASSPMESIFLKTEAFKGGESKRSFVALSNLEDEFLDRTKSDRKDVVEKLARGGAYREGKITYEPSARRYLFGTDPLGRDLLTRVLIGGRISLAVGFAATLVSICIGALWGATAGFVGGKIDSAMMRFADVLYALPFTVIVILLMVMFGRNFILLFVAIGAVEWLTMARIVRGQIISLKNQEFIEAAISLGLPGHRILFGHLIPNVLGPIIIYATLTFPQVMLLEAVLSFLGLGVQPPLSSWGVLIDEGSRTMETSIWLLVCPAFFFSLTLFSLNFLGDGLRDALDPKSSKD
ncbi:MAG: ABC transporter permease [Verrucomicrobia bacterium]|nr:ABC transporter permease [Verrucomicrobiota bacterium]MBV9645190.1 ABC transporter permease [Verrucomicrobiota bacterium]